MDLPSAFVRLQRHEALRSLSLDAVCQYTRLVGHLKNDILLPQPAELTALDQPPEILPRAIGLFLSKVLAIPEDAVQCSWDILKEHIWSSERVGLTKEDREAFKMYGWGLGLTAVTIFPPDEKACCTNVSCERYQKQPLKKEKSRAVLVFTLSDGVQPAYAVHLSCNKCNTQYHNNYSVNGKMRTYYQGIPDYLQVSEHHFVEQRLVRLWVSMLLLGWVSASNSAKAYDLVFSDTSYVNDGDWQFVPHLATEDVWDAFVLFSLLDDKQRRNSVLEVSHEGLNKDHFVAAMEERNRDFILNGQPDAVRHACNKCRRCYQLPDGRIVIVHPIVGDGVSIGRPCCGIFACTEPLQNNRHRFCRTHFNSHFTLHIRKWKLNTNKARASFASKERYSKVQIPHPVAAIFVPEEPSSSEAAEMVEEHLEWFEEDNEGNISLFNGPELGTVGGGVDEQTADKGPNVDPCPSKSPAGNRVFKAQFGRKRTHNKQTLVRPCGIIYARATMFGAEAVSNFLVMLKQAFSVPGALKPRYIFYDSNCLARKQHQEKAFLP